MACFEEDICASHAFVNSNVERKVTLIEVMVKARKPVVSGRPIIKPDCSLKISKLTREVQGLTGHVESNDLKLDTMPGLEEKTGRLREELSKAKGKARLCLR